MTSSISKTQSIRWELKDFRSHWDNKRNADIVSDDFNINAFSFALFFKTNYNGNGYNNSYGIILKDLAGKESVEVSLKLWLENEEGEKFYEHSTEKHIFKRVGNQRRIFLKSTVNDWHLFCKVKKYHETLYICCEFVDLNCQTYIPITDCTQFHQNMWSMYEQEVHDAIIKIGDTEFKILKLQFMAHSEVFKQMFSSNFKERETNIVEIKDVSERAMKQLIRWIYTCQIEDQNAVEDLYKAADKYQIHLLKTNCAELMINSFDNSNVFYRLILAVVYDDKQLKDAAFNIIDKMPKNEAMIFLVSPEWFEFVQKEPVFAKEVNKLINDKLKK